MASAGTIDPSKPGRFPVVLGDSILNPQAPKDVYTGIRYNHKPSLSTPIAPTTARLKPSASTSSSTGSGTGPSTFDLSFSDDGSKYMYTGQRTADSSQYVLTFDAARQVFVLDRVDSMFHMNLSQTPSNGDADQLQREFPHLDIADSDIPIKADGRSGTAAPIPASANTKKPGAGEATVKKEPGVSASAAAGGAGKKKKKAPTQRSKAVLSADVIRPGDSDDDDGNGVVVVKGSTPAPLPPKKPAPRKRQQQVAKKPVEATVIALPTAPPPEPKPAPKKAKNPEPNSDEDEDSDDDDLGLEIEYPGGKPPSSSAGLGFATAVPAIASRRFSELLEVEQHPGGEHFGGSDRDADGDADEEEEFDFEAQDEEESLGSGRFQLPSPVRGQQAPGHEQAAGGYEEDMDAEGDLEAALMAGLEAGEDSDVSEEE